MGTIVGYNERTAKKYIFETKEIYESAEKWFHSNSVDDIVNFCSERGVELKDTEGKFIEDWFWIARLEFVKHGQDGKPIENFNPDSVVHKNLNDNLFHLEH